MHTGRLWPRVPYNHAFPYIRVPARILSARAAPSLAFSSGWEMMHLGRVFSKGWALNIWGAMVLLVARNGHWPFPVMRGGAGLARVVGGW